MNTMLYIVEFLKGKKTYILAALLALYTLEQFAAGDITLAQLIPMLFGSGMVGSMRAAISKV